VAEPVLGLLAEFGTADALLAATRQTRAAGYARIDAYTPYPVEGMAEALALPRGDHRIGWITIAGGLFGFFGMLAVQLFVNWDYPVEVGGRPLFAWPAFFVVDFELMILCAVLFAVIGMFVIIKLPKLHHPLFGTPRFGLASDHRFFLYIDAYDPKFDKDRTRSFLGSLGAWTIEPVRS
jgi:ActD protein